MILLPQDLLSRRQPESFAIADARCSTDAATDGYAATPQADIVLTPVYMCSQFDTCLASADTHDFLKGLC